MDPLQSPRHQSAPPGGKPSGRVWAPLVALLLALAAPGTLRGAEDDPPAGGGGDRSAREKVIARGLDWLVKKQSRRGSWAANEGR